MRRTVGDITILVNNAGAVHGEQVVNISEEEFEHSLKVNTLAHIWVRQLSCCFSSRDSVLHDKN